VLRQRAGTLGEPDRLGAVAHVVLRAGGQEPGEIVDRAEVVRLDRHGLLELPQCRRVFPLQRLGLGQGQVGVEQLRVELHGLLAVLHGQVVHVPRQQHVRQLEVGLRVVLLDIHRREEMGRRLREPPLLLEQPSQVGVRLGIVRIELDGLLEVRRGLVEHASSGQDHPHAPVGVGPLGVGLQHLLEPRHGFVELALVHQHGGRVDVPLPVVGLEFDRRLQFGQGLVKLALPGQLHTPQTALQVFERTHANAHQIVVGTVDKLRQVDRPVRRGRVRNEHGRAVVSILVDVGEKHLRIGCVGFGRKDHPASVGRKAVPGVHQGGVAPHLAGRAARGRDDPQGAVGTHELPVAALDEHHPPAVRRDLGKVVAQAVV